MKPILSNVIIHSIQKKVKRSRGWKELNSFEPFYKPGRSVTSKGELWVNDIKYADTYPNSFCDIWYPNEDVKSTRPTVFYFHGGGFFFGSKTMGDPLAAQSMEDNVISEFLKAGFNIVNADYALCTDYTFPVPILQMNELFTFFLEHGEEYGISMDQVILMGGSAGADMIEIYGTAVNNAVYAKQLGVIPVLNEKKIKALLIDEAALSLDSFRFAMKIMTKAFIGNSNLGCDKAKLLEAPKYIIKKYIPSFVNSSNMEPWFVKSGEDLCRVLDKYNSEYEYCYFPPEVDALEHGYVNRFSENACARECLDRMIAFARKHTEVLG